ncbi:hypothetical protein JQ629_30555 [Bradyrhizobium sp. AUGA SZCCT0222]|uniref:hypothetical protein n=1 Tax=Bradyrhizobium sp. AUGA SZCCT0222 TaxID=2807668 RepID=UPI001BA525DD|nr:hypothetical protein [Bradyrhizobium sp. AUGA SZCCT0222]MBR1271834.1 hypothetical protein [Bradyrhizobium sp. AUGA SZCCT0222]
MIAITTRRLSREEFVNWMAEALVGNPTLPSDAGSQRAKPNDVTLAWPDFQANARPIICVPERQLQEFFAFVSTYSTNVRPFTAYFRVLPTELIESLENNRRVHGNEMQIARMVAGASLAEAWMAAARQSERPSHVLPLLQSSLSLLLGQTVLAGYDDQAFDWALNEWIAARGEGIEAVSKQNVGSSAVAWLHVHRATTALSRGALREFNGPIVEFIAAAVEARSIRPDMLRKLSTIAGVDLDLVKLLAASREERISRFNATIAQLKNRGEGGLKPEFLAGLMLAIAGNGSFEMLRSAREFEGWLDGAVVWFGICAALFDDSNVLVYANSAGRRVVRDILRRDDPFDLPRADIASTELRFMQGSKVDVGQFGVHGPRSIEVEILPNVVTRILSQETSQTERSPDERDILLRTMDEVSYLASRARRILTEGSERQGDIYRSRRPGRSK